MANRFVDTNRYEEDWYCELNGEYQKLWDYICDKCDNAGIWKPNKTGFQTVTKFSVNLGLFLKKINVDKERIIELENGRWFLPGFIKFQWFNKKDSYDLNLSNKLHKSLYTLLKSNGIDLKKVRGLREVLETSRERDNSNNTLSNNTVSNNTISTREIFLKGIEQVREEYLSPQNARAFEQIGMMYFITPEKIVLWVNAFCRKIVSEGETQKTLKDFQKHFAEWLKFQKDIQNPPTGTPPQRKMVF